ncbi:hypothetical protein CBM2587_A160203 [Cupriavidus taiwanensis]|uniref:Uncharacterized protein n=1 Tax=Cupriavidus taiwanensis TaxID=164546 RepID=A0A975WW10_9BURK|nr:hypothetical protein CBM2587_A160203 [Cupriavidus taiwanensis]
MVDLRHGGTSFLGKAGSTPGKPGGVCKAREAGGPARDEPRDGARLEAGRTDQPDGDAFQRELFTGLDDDVGEVRVLGNQFDMAAAPLQALDGDVVAQSCHHDLAVGGFAGAAHGEQVAVEDAGVAHAQPAHAQQVIRTFIEDRGVDLVLAVDMLGGQDGAACRHAAYQRQRQLHYAGHRQRELVRQFRIAARHLQADAARRARRQFDHALARQRPQMFFGGIGRGEAELRCDLGASGRKAGAADRVADQIENLLLPGCQGRHGIAVPCRAAGMDDGGYRPLSSIRRAGHCMFKQYAVILYSIGVSASRILRRVAWTPARAADPGCGKPRAPATIQSRFLAAAFSEQHPCALP